MTGLESDSSPARSFAFLMPAGESAVWGGEASIKYSMQTLIYLRQKISLVVLKIGFYHSLYSHSLISWMQLKWSRDQVI